MLHTPQKPATGRFVYWTFPGRNSPFLMVSGGFSSSSPSEFGHRAFCREEEKPCEQSLANDVSEKARSQDWGRRAFRHRRVLGLPARRPFSHLLFGGEGNPLLKRTNKKKKVGTLILTSLLEDLATNSKYPGENVKPEGAEAEGLLTI